MKLVTYRMEGQMWSQVGALVGERIVPAAHLLSVLGRDPTAGYSMVAFIHRSIR